MSARANLCHVWFTLSLQVNGLIVRPSADQGADTRPNIVLLMSDSFDGRLVDPETAESKVVELPFLDGVLNANGANFVHSYSNNPYCTPSRASMMTGRHSHRIQIYSLAEGLAAAPDGTLDDSCVNGFFGRDWCEWAAQKQGIKKMHDLLPTALYELGYSVNLFGKWHVGSAFMNTAKNFGQGWHADLSAYAFSETPGHLSWQSVGNITDMNTRESHGQIDERKVAKMNERNPDNFHDFDTIHKCIDFINQQPADNHGDQSPFFLYCSLHLPHSPFLTNATWVSMGVNEKYITTPRWPQGGISNYHLFDQYMISDKGDADDPGEQQIRDVRTTYDAMCVQVDAYFSLVWQALVAKGYNFTNTYILHVSDHGELAYEHHQLHKSAPYEGSLRVPFQIAGPGVSRQRITQLTSLLDVFPTLLDMAQETHWEKHIGLDGSSLLAAAGANSNAPLSKQLSDRDYVISQYKAYSSIAGSYMVRSGVWKYVTFGHTYHNSSELPPMLFNVEEDPTEWNNVADSNPHVVSKLDAVLREHVDIDAAEISCDMRLISYILAGHETGHYEVLLKKFQTQFSSAPGHASTFASWFNNTWNLWQKYGSNYMVPRGGRSL